VLLVRGATSAPIAFHLVTYTISFGESGIPLGKTWFVALNGQVRNGASTPVTFVESNGSYAYLVHGPAGYRVSGVAPVGNLTVHGTNLTETVHFVKGSTRTLSFHEAGLIPGSTWCVTVGYPSCSTSGKITFPDLTPASYPYAVESVAGYTVQLKETILGISVPEPLSGVVGLLVHSETLQAKFTPVLYSTVFEQSGLSSGMKWAVKATCTVPKAAKTSCDGMTASGSGTGSGITLMLRNGTYTWKVTPIRGWELKVNGTVEWSGTVRVSGTGLTLNLTFVRDPPGGTIVPVGVRSISGAARLE
jgi:hypothetical protein